MHETVMGAPFTMGRFVPQPLLMFPPGPMHSPMQPYTPEPLTKEKLLAYHHGEIPYSGARGSKDALLPANPCNDASLFDTLPTEKAFDVPQGYDYYNLPMGTVMPPLIPAHPFVYPMDNQMAVGNGTLQKTALFRSFC